MLQTLGILFQATPREVDRELPIAVERVKEILLLCTQEANGVENKFYKVIDIVHEIHLAGLIKKVCA